ncbi:WAT1-related protein, partial [Cucurbita argyrosperma subsp. argyrosperma]
MAKLYASCAAMVAVQIGYGGSNILMKVASEKDLDPFVFFVYRHIIAFLVLLPFAYVIDRNKRASLTISMTIKIFLLAILGSTTYLNLFYLGIKYTSATVASAFNLRNWISKLREVVRKSVGARFISWHVPIFTFWIRHTINQSHLQEPLINIYRMRTSGHRQRQGWIKGSAFIVLSEMSWSAWLSLQPGRSFLYRIGSVFGAVGKKADHVVADETAGEGKGVL